MAPIPQSVFAVHPQHLREMCFCWRGSGIESSVSKNGGQQKVLVITEDDL